MQRRLAVGLLALTLLTTFPFAPGTTASDGSTKYDEYLTLALAGDPAYAKWADHLGRFEVLVQGPLPSVPETMPASREAWNAHWQAEAAPFFAALRAALRPGDELDMELATVSVAKVKLTPARIAALAAMPQVRGLALDWPEAVQLLDLQVPDGPGVQMGQSVGMTGAFDVHNLGFLGQGVSLAVIDTGIRPTHEMLLNPDGSSRVLGWFDMTDPAGNRCATPCDTHGHGTHVATTAAGSNVAGGRYQGVAPRADVYGVRIFQGGGGSWEDAQEGLQGAFDLGVDLTTNSWGGGCGGATGGGTITENLAKTLALAGLQHIFAAGNSGAGSQGELCPGRNDYVISVAATDKSKNIASFSSGGLCPDATGAKTRICPDVAAVGVNVEAGHNPCDSCYTSMSGTSMATPHVAGAAVLTYQLRSALHGGAAYSVPLQELEQFFEANAEDLGAVGNDQRYGHGFIQVDEMLNDLLPGSQARASIAVSVANAEMRNRDTNSANIMVNNVGGKTLTGTVRLVSGGILEHDGHNYLSQPVTLAPGAMASFDVAIPGAGLHPTTYHLLASFEYSYTSDTATTVTTEVEDSTTFIVRGVRMGVTRAGSGGNWNNGIETGNQTTVRLELRNVGNEPASQVDLTEGIPLLGFGIVPGTNTASPPFSLLTVPGANEIAPNVDRQTLDFSYAPGAINPGAPYNVQYKLVALVPGTYSFVAHVTYVDGVGDPYEQTLVDTKTVVCKTVKSPSATVPLNLDPC